jgi:replication factor A1
MHINELQARQGKVDLEGEIVSKEEPRTFSKFGKDGKVCNAMLKDETGEVKLTLWNEHVDQVNVGDKVKITNGYVGEWQGEKQLSTGKFGSLEVIGAGQPGEPGQPSPGQPSPQPTPTTPPPEPSSEPPQPGPEPTPEPGTPHEEPINLDEEEIV